MSIQAPVRVWGLTCPGSAEEVGRARRWTRDILRDCPCADDAALIVSELGTNAIIHTASGTSSGTFHIALARSDRVVAIAVTDTGSTGNVPHIDQADQDATHGRGLGMVAALATNLDIHGDHHGRTITAELLMQPNAEPQPTTPTELPLHHRGSEATSPPSNPTTTRVRPRPGYWCECTTHTPDALNSPVTVAAFDASSPAQAIRWIRIAARTLASSLDPDAFQDAWQWITEGHGEASDALSQGEPCTFTITHHQTRVEWTARPVLFLPMAPSKPTYPRACATDFPAHIG